jgi:hypothetical protein
MSTVKKPQSLYIYVFSIGYVYFVFRDIEKRKRQSPPAPPPPTKSKIARRLDKLRSGQRGIWDDEDNEDDDLEQNVEPKSTTSNKTYIVLSDSDDEKLPSRSNKSRKKKSQICDETLPSENDNKPISKCATCLICSILSNLTSYNCCSKHLSILLNHTNHRKQTTNTDQWPPQQVMIVPMTDEFIQRYVDTQQIHRLRASPTSKKSIERHTSVSRKMHPFSIQFNFFFSLENYRRNQQ